MVRGLVSFVLALVLVAAQIAFIAVLTSCSSNGPASFDDIATTDGATTALIDSALGAHGADATIGDAGDAAGSPAACGFGAAPRIKLNGTVYSATVTAVPEILNCCDAVKYRFVHDDSAFAFAVNLEIRKTVGWMVPGTVTLGGPNVSSNLDWECLRGCVPTTVPLFSTTGELDLRGDLTHTLGTLCASVVDSSQGHPVIDTLELYAVDTPFGP